VTALADLSDLVNKASGGSLGTPENLFFHKQARVAGANAVATVVGYPTSLWRFEGQPSHGAVPTTAAVPDNTTAGGLIQANPGGSREKFLYSIFAITRVAGTLVLYDRLLHNGGLSGTSVSAQDVQTATPTPAITRYTDGIGNMAWAEIYTIVGTTARTISMSYVDELGNTQASPGVVFGAASNREVGRAVMMSLADGDRGVQAVETVTLDGSTGAAGSFGVTIGHPLAYLATSQAGTASWRDFTTGLPGIPKIENNACLAFLWYPNTTTAPEILGGLSMVES
jgi:hypothetical protein